MASDTPQLWDGIPLIAIHFLYQFDVDVVGGRSASDADHDGVWLSSAEAERDLITSGVGPRRLWVGEG